MQGTYAACRCLRASTSTTNMRAFSRTAIARSGPAASTSNAASAEKSQRYRSNRRYFDSLDQKHSPYAQHSELSDKPSLRFTVRPPSSPAPPTMPAASTSIPSASTSSMQSDVTATSEAQLPPKLHKDAPQYATLSPEQIAEMQALRLSDPATWTRSKLASKYNVSPFFVAMKSFGDSTEGKTKAKQVIQAHREKIAQTQEGWGFKKRVDREVRRRRKEFW